MRTSKCAARSSHAVVFLPAAPLAVAKSLPTRVPTIRDRFSVSRRGAAAFERARDRRVGSSVCLGHRDGDHTANGQPAQRVPRDEIAIVVRDVVQEAGLGWRCALSDRWCRDGIRNDIKTTRPGSGNPPTRRRAMRCRPARSTPRAASSNASVAASRPSVRLATSPYVVSPHFLPPLPAVSGPLESEFLNEKPCRRLASRGAVLAIRSVVSFKPLTMSHARNEMVRRRAGRGGHRLRRSTTGNAGRDGCAGCGCGRNADSADRLALRRPATRRACPDRQAVHRRPRRADQAAVDSCRRDVQPHALLRRSGAGARDCLRVVEAVRGGPERGTEDRQPQGARRDGADDAGAVVPGAGRRQDRHGRRDGHRDARARKTGGLLDADPHQRQPGDRHRSRRAADCDR